MHLHVIEHYSALYIVSALITGVALEINRDARDIVGRHVCSQLKQYCVMEVKKGQH